MAKQITIKDDSDSGEDPQLVAKVDAMMDPDLPEKVDQPEPDKPTKTDKKESKPEPAADNNDLPPLDIFADAPSAPILEDVPAKTAKDKAGKPADSAPLEVEPDKPTTEENSLSEADNSQTSLNDETPIEPAQAEPDNYDDQSTAEAVDDIVAHESDTALNVADQQTAEAQAAVATKESGHPFFWSLVALLCIIVIVLAVFLFDPSLHSPIHWSAIKKHL